MGRKKTRVVYIKLLFYMPWELFQNRDGLRCAIAHIAERCNLQICGVLTAKVANAVYPRVLDDLKDMYGTGLVWLQVPGTLTEECALYELTDDSSNHLSSVGL